MPNLALLNEHDRYLADHYTELRAARAAEDDRLWCCFLLSRDLATFQALIDGERVPRALLNQDVLEELDSWAA
jgi:hypothetical protein